MSLYEKFKDANNPKKEKCPNCSMFKTMRKRDIQSNAGIIVGSCGSCVSLIIFFPLAPFMLLAGFGYAIIKYFATSKKVWTCQHCKNEWELST
jgi:hypothetical protein